MEQYALYLRKSRADLDAEARGEGETLAKHRRALTDMAKRRGLFIAREYAELVSGDTIAARPQMQTLLADVKAGLYAGVIVNDVDRLGRGDSIDQEIIKLTFAASHTLIITPAKDIDFANSMDEDLYDFKAFFFRAEYKMISRRMAQGRERSASAGNFVAPRPPYGYQKAVIDGRPTLTPDPDTAPIAKMIFGWYASGELGYLGIAKRLCEMGLKTYMGVNFTGGTIKRMLTNTIYIGCITWGATRQTSTVEDGRRVKKTVRKITPKLIPNAHEAIIDKDVFEAVQKRLKTASHAAPNHYSNDLVNPLSGLAKCALCGATLKTCHCGKTTDTNHVYLRCPTYGCPTRGIAISYVVDAVLETLRGWCATYDGIEPDAPPPIDEARVAALQHQLDVIAGQLRRAREFAERDIYTPDEYLQRRDELNVQRKALENELEAAQKPPANESIANIIPEVKSVLDAFESATTHQQNMLLKTVIARIDYTKTIHAKRTENPAKYMTLDVMPLISNVI